MTLEELISVGLNTLEYEVNLALGLFIVSLTKRVDIVFIKFSIFLYRCYVVFVKV